MVFSLMIVDQVIQSTHEFVTCTGGLITVFIPEVCCNKYIRMISDLFKVNSLKKR